MQNKKPTRFIDFAPAKKRPSVQLPAQPAAQASRPQPALARPVAARTPVQKRPLSSGPAHSTLPATDPLSARPVSRPAGPSPRPVATRPVQGIRSVAPAPRAAHSAPRPATSAPRASTPRPATAAVRPRRPAQAAPRPTQAAPRIVQQTSVQAITATKDSVESFEFGVIEDLSPVVKPEPPMIPGSPIAEEQPKASPTAKAPHKSAFHRSSTESEPEKPSRFPRKKAALPAKSPFLSSVSVQKRPLSASAPTGIHAPAAPARANSPADTKPAKKRKNAPFIVIVILSVLLGVSLGALVYFVLPH